MGFDRSVLKQRAKNAIGRNYGSSVLVAFIFSLVTGVNSSAGNNVRYNVGESDSFLSGIAALGVLMTGIVIFLLVTFVFNILQVGANRFFIENRDYNAPVSKILFGFQNGHYGNEVWTLFLMNLKISLWSLLLVIPGIIKSYEYKMVPYILAEQPDISPEQAFLISRDMMMGNKMDTFILELSFFGWLVLTIITCGLAGIFWTQPYIQATYAELYAALRDEWMYRNRPVDSNITGENF